MLFQQPIDLQESRIRYIDTFDVIWQRRSSLLWTGSVVLMTTQEAISSFAASTPSNWFELAVLGKSMSLREAQRQMSTTPSPSVKGPISVANGSATPRDSQERSGARDEKAQLFSGPESRSSDLQRDNSKPAEQRIVQGNVPSFLATSSANPTSSGSDNLRTEVLGPPPSLPNDIAYWPLNPAPLEVPLPVLQNKKKGATNNAKQKILPRKDAADYDAPSNLNGKMPFALYQTIKDGVHHKPR